MVQLTCYRTIITSMPTIVNFVPPGTQNCTETMKISVHSLSDH
jgi:hypothetical protein